MDAAPGTGSAQQLLTAVLGLGTTCVPWGGTVGVWRRPQQVVCSQPVFPGREPGVAFSLGLEICAPSHSRCRMAAVSELSPCPEQQQPGALEQILGCGCTRL